MADIVGPLLVRAGLITQEQLVAAHQARRQTGGTLTEHLIARRVLDEEALCAFFRQRLLVPLVSYNDLSRIAPSVIKRLPPELAGEFRVIPMAFDREQNLTVAMADPSDTHAIDEIGFFTGSFVMRAVAAPTAIAWALYHYYNIQTMLLPKLAARFPEAAPQALGGAASPTLVSPQAPANLPPGAASPSAQRPAVAPPTARTLVPPPPELPAAAPAARSAPSSPMHVADTPSGAVVLVDRPPLPDRVPSEPKVIVNLEPPAPPPPATPAPAAPAARPSGKRPAMIIEDHFGEDTPLPAPVPFDITGPFVRPDLSMVEPAPPAPSPAAAQALTAAIGALRAASERDHVAAALVGYMGRLFRRSAFFVVKKGELSGFLGHGGGLHPDELRRATLKLDRSSTFREVLQTRLPFRGPVTDPPSRDFLIDAMGWAPETVLVVPIAVRERVVGILYGDDELEPVPEEHVQEIARAGAAAFETILAARKG